jgi:hypothetical protein
MTHQFLKGAAAATAGLFLTFSAVQAVEPLMDAEGIPGEYSANVAVISEYDFRGIALTYDFSGGSATASVNYSPKNLGDSGTAWYPQPGIEVPARKHLTLSGHVARQYIQDNATFGGPDYMEYGLGASVNLARFDVKLTGSDTDHNDSECDDACGVLLLSLSQSF